VQVLIAAVSDQDRPEAGLPMPWRFQSSSVVVSKRFNSAGSRPVTQ
jgi:hypothetical protein